MSEPLLCRMRRMVRRFGGPLPIDDLLPELDAAAGESVPGESTAGESRPTRHAG